MKKKILVIAAHPDDEILGPGGTLIKHVLQGDDVFCLILGQGAMARAGASESSVEQLRQEALAAAKVIGFKEIYFSDFPDNQFDKISLLSIVNEVEKYIDKIRPDIVYTHFENDLNIDHRLTFQAVLTACRPCHEGAPKAIYSFETLSCTEWQMAGKNFKPNVYVDIENVIEIKMDALKKYDSEIRKYPHPRSPEGIKILAQYRGLESGLRFAEGLCLVRICSVRKRE